MRLFRRSTRHLSLTAEGENFLARCRRIPAEVEAAEQELSASAKGPSGKLRISLPRYSGLFDNAILAFMQAYPAVERRASGEPRLHVIRFMPCGSAGFLKAVSKARAQR